MSTPNGDDSTGLTINEVRSVSLVCLISLAFQVELAKSNLVVLKKILDAEDFNQINHLLGAICSHFQYDNDVINRLLFVDKVFEKKLLY
jgi:hypothetical protein